jgi:hypothetical protein
MAGFFLWIPGGKKTPKNFLYKIFVLINFSYLCLPKKRGTVVCLLPGEVLKIIIS